MSGDISDLGESVEEDSSVIESVLNRAKDNIEISSDEEFEQDEQEEEIEEESELEKFNESSSEEHVTSHNNETSSSDSLINIESALEFQDEAQIEVDNKIDTVYETLNDVLDNFKIPGEEPWPQDVKLFQPYEVEQILLPDNANCLAVQAFMKMCNLPFLVEPRANAEAMSPSGKVPFIKAGAFVISELEPIVQFINNKGITLTEKLDSEMKSDLRAYMSLVHNVMEVAELYICWCDKETYNQVTSVRYGSIYPWPLNHIQNRVKRNSVIKKLKVLGWFEKSLLQIFEEVDTCCLALTDRLEGKDYFFGDKPTELDALVFGHLFTILTTPLPNSHMANIVRNYPVLINLVQRIEKDYFKRETKH